MMKFIASDGKGKNDGKLIHVNDKRYLFNFLLAQTHTKLETRVLSTM